MSTAGTTSSFELFQLLRGRALDATQPDAAPTLRTTLDERFYWNAGPTPEDPQASVSYPYCVGRFLNQQSIAARGRWRADFEVYVFDRPRSKQLAAETIADRLEYALGGYTDARYGFVMVNPASPRDTLPPTPPPGDRELVQVRLLFEVIAYPQRLAR